ncbi:Csu type fimbrial protein [Rhizobium tumorigenes]|uniref:Spore coat U domain-containing protein n=1 Tax=Rhizobium tumorigenes TaxID=2041385 RepID=A0AAF1KTR4_9HYPH|nr:spore coat U domain-containing protein [Rhizobium tumorigenes]WFR99188.1 spore coat U domain-containing protein [Rhizobium tumorigenes]
MSIHKVMLGLLGVVTSIGFTLAAMPANAQSCTVTMANLNFGTVNLLGGASVDSSTTVSINCSNTLNVSTNVRVCINVGGGSGGMVGGARTMANGANLLQYQLYQDASRSTPLGSLDLPALGAPQPFDLLLLPLTSASMTRSVYGRILATQPTTPGGAYSSLFTGSSFRVNWTPYTLTAPACSSVTQNPTFSAFSVQSFVDRTCSVTAQNLNFGSQGLLKTKVDASTDLSVTCTSGLPFSISLNGGLTNAVPAQRKMTNGTNSITYGLFRDAARSQLWGSLAGLLASGTGTGLVQRLVVYGRVPAQTTPPIGTYSDTVVVTITY